MFYQFLLYIFVAFMLYFFSLICAIPHLICKRLSFSYLRLLFLYLRHVCLRRLHLRLSSAICHMCHFNYVLRLPVPARLFFFFSSHVPRRFDVDHLHLSPSHLSFPIIPVTHVPSLSLSRVPAVQIDMCNFTSL